MARKHEETSKDGLAHPYGVEFVGPLALEPAYDVLVTGKHVPHLTLHPVSNDPEGEWMLTLDRRLMIVGTDIEMRKWLRFLSDAMAVAAGYPCFGTDKRSNPFNVRAVSLSSGEVEALNRTDETDETDTDE